MEEEKIVNSSDSSKLLDKLSELMDSGICLDSSEECEVNNEKKIVNSSDSTNLFDKLSESLLIEILVRLPSKSAIQFKSVCKLWNSLISSRDFIRFFNHRRHDRSLPPIHDSDSSSYSIVFQLPRNNPSDGLYKNSPQFHCRYTGGVAEFTGSHSLDLSFLPCWPEEIQLNASCNGLLLCSSFKKTEKETRISAITSFYVCNLQTMQWIALPPNRNFVGHATGFLCVPAPCSLCHSQGIGGVDMTDYKFTVVQFPYEYDEGEHSQFTVKLFSSEEGQWRTIALSYPRDLSFRMDFHSAVVAYKGMLHWLKYPYVLVFDPYNVPGKIYRAIELPSMPQSNSLIGIGVWEDRLRVTCSDKEDSLCSIWELKDYDMGEWTLMHQLCVSKAEIICYVPYLYPDGIAFCRLMDNSLWLFNFGSGEAEFMFPKGHRLPDLYNNFWNFLKIDDQWWPTPVPSLPSNIQS